MKKYDRLVTLEGAIMRGRLCCGLLCLLLLGGCTTKSPPPTYTRTDGRPIDAAQEQATLAQCKGEAATTVVQIGNATWAAFERAQKEATILSACMARNGYIQPQ